MAVHTKHSDLCRAMVRLSEIKELPSHRWMVDVLAEMIEYSEAHELQEVTNSLVAAIEIVSPLLISPRTAQAPSRDNVLHLSKKTLVNVGNMNSLSRRAGNIK